MDHAVTFLGLRINQWTSIVLFVGALVYLWVTRNKDTEEIVVPASHKQDGGEAADPALPTDQADAEADTRRAPGGS
ncbi:hypothetical protein ACFLIM_35630 [Nonomuraea sp. M3C6]|uniref:Cbb3-type cytochrome c oxidase subunit 3 n=1 Tax=Nonomuraea marmarensis TaxID=3351344 RepID=A0ABW7AMC6_9ACTN